LIQTIGRAARNVAGQVHMYADKITPSMEAAIDETNRRRAIQVAYNTEHGIDPQPLRKRIADVTDMLAREDADTEGLMKEYRSTDGRKPAKALDASTMAVTELTQLIEELTAQMHQAAAELQFEVAARHRDEVADLKKELRAMIEASK
ncbi:MAG TPA: UvrB/UvrC motif-containing protein, partial [Tessaracoccus flavescens]|nr:UvrB/UvrC motif-containing protein [Tessaracoccus flavescens]